MTLEELRDALAINGWPGKSTSLKEHLQRSRIQLFKDNWAPMEREIIDKCGCLIDVVRPAASIGFKNQVRHVSGQTSEFKSPIKEPENSCFTKQTQRRH
jgi:hypothetical protein